MSYGGSSDGGEETKDDDDDAVAMTGGRLRGDGDDAIRSLAEAAAGRRPTTILPPLHSHSHSQAVPAATAVPPVERTPPEPSSVSSVDGAASARVGGTADDVAPVPRRRRRQAPERERGAGLGVAPVPRREERQAHAVAVVPNPLGGAAASAAISPHPERGATPAAATPPPPPTPLPDAVVDVVDDVDDDLRTPTYLHLQPGFNPTWTDLLPSASASAPPPPPPEPTRPDPAALAAAAAAAAAAAVQRRYRPTSVYTPSYALSLLSVSEFTVTAIPHPFDVATEPEDLQPSLGNEFRDCLRNIFCVTEKPESPARNDATKDDDESCDGREGTGTSSALRTDASFEEGKWRIPLSAYRPFHAYLAHEKGRYQVEGIPEEQLKAATLGRERLDRSYPSSEALVKRGVPRGLANALAPYQRGGVEFVLERGGRALLADEMGLGKTVQAIASMSCYAPSEWPVLVLCPSSARYHWRHEFRHWLGVESSVHHHAAAPSPAGDGASTSTVDARFDNSSSENDGSGGGAGAGSEGEAACTSTATMMTTTTTTTRQPPLKKRRLNNSSSLVHVPPPPVGTTTTPARATSTSTMPLLLDSQIRVLSSSNDDLLGPGGRGPGGVGEPRVIICSYGLILPLIAKSKLLPSLFKTIIVDESHMLKSQSSKRTKALVPILKAATRVLMLSGTPAMAHPRELWPQLNVLGDRSSSSADGIDVDIGGRGNGNDNSNGGGSGGVGGSGSASASASASSWWQDEDDFLTKYVRGKNKRGQEKNFAELHTLLTSTVMLRRTKADMLKSLPNKTRERLEVDVLGRDKKELREEFAQCMATLRTTNGALGCIAREQQEQTTGARGGQHEYTETHSHDTDRTESRERCCGGDEPNTTSKRRDVLNKLYGLTGRAKVPLVAAMLKRWLSDPTKGKICVFAHHVHVLDAIVKESGLSNDSNCSGNTNRGRGARYMRIDGRTPPKERQSNIESFQSDPTVRVAILGVTAASVAVNLTAASTVLFAELFWTPAIMLQAEDRCHRIGQVAAVRCLYLIARGTLDEVLWRLMEKKYRDLGEFVEGREGEDIAVHVRHGEGGNDSDAVEAVAGVGGPAVKSAFADLLDDDGASGGGNGDNGGEVVAPDANSMLEGEIEALGAEEEEAAMLSSAVASSGSHDSDDADEAPTASSASPRSSSSGVAAALGAGRTSLTSSVGGQQQHHATLHPQSSPAEFDPHMPLPSLLLYKLDFTRSFGLSLKPYFGRMVVTSKSPRRIQELGPAVKPDVGDFLVMINGVYLPKGMECRSMLTLLKDALSNSPTAELVFGEDDGFARAFHDDSEQVVVAAIAPPPIAAADKGRGGGAGGGGPQRRLGAGSSFVDVDVASSSSSLPPQIRLRPPLRRRYRLHFTANFGLILSSFDGRLVVKGKTPARIQEFGSHSKPDLGDTLAAVNGVTIIPGVTDSRRVLFLLKGALMGEAPAELAFEFDPEFRGRFYREELGGREVPDKGGGRRRLSGGNGGPVPVSA